MPIAGLVDLIAHANSNKFIEPVKRNNARLRLTTANLLKVLKNQFSDDSSYLDIIGPALAGDIYPLDVTFTPPAISTDVRHHVGINNITTNYGGYTTYGPCSCSYNNFIGADTYRFFYRWALLPGALSIKPNHTNLEPVAVTSALPIPDLSGSSTGYKVNGVISQYYTYNPAVGDEVEYHQWLLQGMWPSSVTTTGFDLATDTGSMLMTSVEFTVDLAFPIQGLMKPQGSPGVSAPDVLPAKNIA